MSHLFNEDYERLVGQLITENSTDIVRNTTKEKASVVYKSMINEAKESVCIYLNEFDMQLLNDETRKALISAVYRGVSVSVVIQDKARAWAELKFFDNPLNHVVSKGVREPGKCDFCVVDKKMFHIDATPMKKDSENISHYEALYSVNNPNVCDKLLECYWKLIAPLPTLQNRNSDFKPLFYAELEEKMPQIKTRMDYMQCLTRIIADKSKELSAEKYQKLRQEAMQYLREIQSRPDATPQELIEELGCVKKPTQTMNLYKMMAQNQHQHTKDE